MIQIATSSILLIIKDKTTNTTLKLVSSGNKTLKKILSSVTNTYNFKIVYFLISVPSTLKLINNYEMILR